MKKILLSLVLVLVCSNAFAGNILMKQSEWIGNTASMRMIFDYSGSTLKLIGWNNVTLPTVNGVNITTIPSTYMTIAGATIYMLKSGSTMSGDLSMGTYKITGLGVPLNATDAATKQYVLDSTGGGSTMVCTATGLTYGAGTLSMTAGYIIPTTGATLQWDNAAISSHAKGHALLSTTDHTDVATYLDQVVLITSVPTGTIVMYGSTLAPTGWLLCDGSAVNRVTYANLFTAISTTFGIGDGSTTFNVPDMRCLFPKGAGSSHTVGSVAYAASTLGLEANDKMQGHKHLSLHSTIDHTWSSGTAPATRCEVNPSGAFNQDTGVPKTDGTNGTPRTGTTTEPQSLGLTFIIKI